MFDTLQSATPMPQADPNQPEKALDLIYKIDGTPNDVDVFELSPILDSFGQVLEEDTIQKGASLLELLKNPSKTESRRRSSRRGRTTMNFTQETVPQFR